MDRELIQKGLDLFERWVAAYERRLEFEEKRDERIAADQAKIFGSYRPASARRCCTVQQRSKIFEVFAVPDVLAKIKARAAKAAEGVVSDG